MGAEGHNNRAELGAKGLELRGGGGSGGRGRVEAEGEACSVSGGVADLRLAMAATNGECCTETI